MKKPILTFLISCFAVFAFSQVSITVDVTTPGTFSAQLAAAGGNAYTVTNLTVTGNINDVDISFMNTSMPVLAVLDLEAVHINQSANNFTDNFPDHAFENKTSLTSIKLPSSITVIGWGAFKGCSELSCNLTIPNSVTEIQYEAFSGCSKLSGSLVIPNSVTSIYQRAFQNCSGFTGTLTLPNSITFIDGWTFWGCSGFTGPLTIPNTVTTIGYGAFDSCNGFNGELTLSNSLTKIEDYAFSWCSGLTGNLVLPSTLVTISKGAFDDCQNLTGDLIIPNSVKTIDDFAFAGCKGFNGGLTISNSVSALGLGAFYNCSGLTGNLVIPSSITSIGGSAFVYCKGFTGNLVIPNSVITIGGSAFDGCTGFNGTLTISSSATSIGQYAFNDCSGLIGDITIPNSVITIGNSAFEDCSHFNGNLYIGSSVTTIGKNAFANCTGLTGTLIISSATSIGESAFYNCSNLTGPLAIPSTVTSIAKQAFYNCQKLTGNLTIPNSVTYIGESAFQICSGLNGSLTLPNSITTIGAGAFCNCSNLTGSLVLPNTITAINESTFYNCTKLTGNLNIPSTVKTIGGYAFQSCSGLTGNLVFPSLISSIGPYAFKGCSGLTGNLTIPSTVTTLDFGAFYDCTGFSGTLTIPSSITSIGYGTFYNCKNLTGTITIPNSITSIGSDAFHNCFKLTGNITIPSSVTTIGSFAFGFCTSITGILTIPSSVTSLAEYAFSGCSGLSKITAAQVVPLTIGANTFNSVNKTTCQLVVPSGSTAAYRAADYWKDFTNISELIYVSFNSQGGSAVPDLNPAYNTKITEPTAPTRTGYTFSGWYKEAACTNAWNFSTDLVTTNTTLYAKWTINVYTVTFDSQGGTSVASVNTNYNTTISTPTEPTRTGYTFAGWYKESACTNIWNFTTNLVTNNTTLYAKWIVNVYLVTFNTQGGSTVASVYADYNSTISTPTAPTRTGYTFGGWYKETGCTNAWTFASDVVTGNLTLYAKWTINVYTVTFNSQGGTTVASVNTNYNTTITAPTAPTRTGYTFVGWYKEAACTNSWNFSTSTVTANTTLYAKWTINTYTVTFNSQGGTTIASVNAQYGTTITAPASPTKTGYTFVGWYKDAGGINVWTFASDWVSGNLTLYAKWTINSYTVSFNSQGGSTISSISANYNTTISSPTPSKTGYTFAGWYKEANCINAWNFSSDKVTSNITLYAKWTTNKYTVTFYSNGGSDVPDIQVDYNSTFAAPTPPTRTGYTFAGWYKEMECINAWNFSTDRVTENIVLQAKWTINFYAITFNTNGGSAVTPVSAEYNTTINEPETPTKEGYSFVGWYTDAAFTNYFDYQMYYITSNLTLYAKWEINSYWVKFNSEGGTVIFDIKVDYKNLIPKPQDPIWEGHTFQGWYKESSFTNLWNFNSDLVTSDITLYAKWSINMYTVHFDSQGGSTIQDQSLPYNTILDEPTPPTRTGYTFKGWYNESTFDTRWIFGFGRITQNTTLYARWEANIYTISFDTQGGGTIASVSLPYDSKITEPTPPSREGYTFAGWYKDINCTNPWNFSVDVVSGDATLYAKWTINTYTISFYTNGGSAIASITANYNSTITAPTTPTKTGYTFVNWYKDAACTSVWNFSSDKVTANITLFAKWTINTYTINFDTQGGSTVSSITTNYNTTITQPVAPTRNGYTFSGWYKESTCTNAWNFSTDVVTSNITLYAKWNLANAIEDIQSNEFKLYPNPAVDYVTLEGNNMKEVSIYNLSGVRVIQVVVKEKDKTTIDLNGLKTGVYLMHITTFDNTKSVLKFIKG